MQRRSYAAASVRVYTGGASNALDGGAELVAKGDAEIGIYPISEIVSVPGLAEAFVQFLADPSTRRHWTKAGFDPPSGS